MLKLIVSKDEVFYLLDKPTFRQLIHYLRPSLLMKDIPHHIKIHEEVLVHARQAKSKVKAMLQVHNAFSFCLPGFVLIILQDCWGGDLLHIRHLDIW